MASSRPRPPELFLAETALSQPTRDESDRVAATPTGVGGRVDPAGPVSPSVAIETDAPDLLVYCPAPADLCTTFGGARPAPVVDSHRGEEDRAAE